MANQRRKIQRLYNPLPRGTHIALALAALTAACTAEETDALPDTSTAPLEAATNPAQDGSAQNLKSQANALTGKPMSHGAIDPGPQSKVGQPQQNRDPLLFKRDKPARDPSHPKQKLTSSFVTATATPPRPTSTVDVAESRRRSDSYLQQWEARRNQYDGLSPAEAEAARANLKRSILGE